MKILFVGHTYTVKVNRDKLYHLSKISGIQLRLITPKIWNEWTKKNRSEAFADENIELKTYRTLFNSNEGRYFFTSLSLGLKEFQPDIIHVEQGLDAYSYFQILLLKKIHKLHAKTVAFTWVNLPYKHRNPVKNFIEKFNMNNTDFIICGNREAQQILESKKFKGRSCVMPQLGIDPTMYRRKDVTKLKLKMGLNGFTIGYIGRITYQKGLATLFLALGTMKKLNWKLLMVGGEDWEKGYKKKLVEIAEKVGITRRIIWVDTINHDEAPDYFNCMDISVLPSLTLPYWKEQFGHTIIESMACARSSLFSR